MHDAFLKIYGAFDRFSYRGPGSLRAWIERIAVNVALEWLRNRNKLNFRTLDEGRALPDVPEPDQMCIRDSPRPPPCVPRYLKTYFSTVNYQLAFYLVDRLYVADIQNYVVIILFVSGHQTEFIVPVGEPNYPQSYNFSADNHIFAPRNNRIRVRGFQQDCLLYTSYWRLRKCGRLFPCQSYLQR